RSGAAIAEVLARLPLDVVPDLDRALDQRQFGRAATLLAQEAPVAARLLARYLPLLEDHDPQSLSGHAIRCRTANDASADDDDVGLLRPIRCWGDEFAPG